MNPEPNNPPCNIGLEIPLSPVPIPEQPDLSGIIGMECLNYLDPIDDPLLLQLHVSQLTGVVKFLWERMEDLECQLKQLTQP